MLLTMRRRRKIVTIMCCVALSSVTYCTIKGFISKKVANSYEQKIMSIQNELKEEEAKLESLENELEQVDSLEYIEKTAQDRLGLVRSDAIIIKEKKNP